MSDFSSFQSSILNILGEDKEPKIKEIVKKEVAKIRKITPSLEGFCKVLANQIAYEIKKADPSIQITPYFLEEVDHVILLLEYYYQGQKEMILVDPTFSQFTKQEGKVLLHRKTWPSEKLPAVFVDSLLKDGLVKINEDEWQMFVNAFNDEEIKKL